MSISSNGERRPGADALQRFPRLVAEVAARPRVERDGRHRRISGAALDGRLAPGAAPRRGRGRRSCRSGSRRAGACRRTRRASARGRRRGKVRLRRTLPLASTRSRTSLSATWIEVCAPRLNAPSVKRTRRPLRSTFSGPTATGSTLSGRTSHGTEATTAVAASSTSRRPKIVPGLGRRTVTGAGVPGGERGAAAAGRSRRRWRAASTWVAGGRVELDAIGSSAPETAVGGSAVIPAGRAPAAIPAPARSGGRLAGSAAAISAARSCAGESSGCARASSAASAATCAAAIAVPPHDGPPPSPVSALPGRREVGLGQPARGRALGGERGDVRGGWRVGLRAALGGAEARRRCRA